MKKLEEYSPACIRHVFDGVRVSPVLDFSYDANREDFVAGMKVLSISGVQEKLSALVRSKKICLTPEGECGRYIIKPAPDYRYLRLRDQLPANEHLTMQIAKQVYKIKTAENALVCFADGQLAYLTKRFDYAADGSKIAQEDFASLAGKTEENGGVAYKYSGSYEQAAALIQQSVAAWKVEMSRYFKRVVFNYLFGNGDAHLKDFSVQHTSAGDYIMAPSYGLLNTTLHIDDRIFALQEGLMPQEFHSDYYKITGYPCRDDFAQFGHRIGVLPKKIESILDLFATEQSQVYELIDASYLDESSRELYRQTYQSRLHHLQQTQTEQEK